MVRCLTSVRLIFVCFVYWWIAACTLPAPAPTEKGEFVRVVKVIDGDTIVVSDGNTTNKVRLIGVDTPETRHPTKPVQYFGREATAFTKRYLEGKRVRLWRDPIGDTRDHYGRLLRHVFVNGENFNAKLVAEGYAFAYRDRRFPFSRRSEFILLEKKARAQGKGLWGRRGRGHQ